MQRVTGISRLRFRLVALALGTSPLVASGCDPQIQASVLSALESSASTLLDALLDAAIQSLEPDEEPPITTV